MIMCWYLPEKIIIKVEHCLLRNERHNSAEPSAGFSYILGLCWGHGGALHMEEFTHRTGCDSHDKRFAHAHMKYYACNMTMV